LFAYGYEDGSPTNDKNGFFSDSADAATYPWKLTFANNYVGYFIAAALVRRRHHPIVQLF